MGVRNKSDIRDQVVASFSLLVQGVQVCRYGESAMVHGMCTEIRGDWKWQKEFLMLNL